MENSLFDIEDIRLISKDLLPYLGMIKGRTFLVAGGSGYIGMHIVEVLRYLNENHLKTKCKIISIDNFISPTSVYKNQIKVPNLKMIKKDITKPIKINGKVDYILNAAGIASPVSYKKHMLETIDTTIIGTRNLLDFTRNKKAKSFVFFSSSEIYGNPPDDKVPTKETFKGNVSSIGPRSCYDESKRLGETLCMTYFQLYKTPIKIIRPFNIYGPGMKSDDFRVVPNFIYKGLTGQDITVHVNGKQTRTFCYISDSIRGIFYVLFSNKNGEVYNIGNDRDEINMNKLAQMVAKIAKSKSRIKNVKYPIGYPDDEPQRRCPDLTKIKKDMGYRPKITLEKGLFKTILWCKNNWKLN